MVTEISAEEAEKIRQGKESGWCKTPSLGNHFTRVKEVGLFTRPDKPTRFGPDFIKRNGKNLLCLQQLGQDDLRKPRMRLIFRLERGEEKDALTIIAHLDGGKVVHARSYKIKNGETEDRKFEEDDVDKHEEQFVRHFRQDDEMSEKFYEHYHDAVDILLGKKSK